MSIQMNASLPLPHGITKAEIMELWESIPDDATVGVTVHTADRWGSDTYDLKFSWGGKKTETKPEITPEVIDGCVFDMAWVGKCQKATVLGKRFCSEHVKEKCYSCGKQAFSDCEATIGAFVCGQPQCKAHRHH